MANTAEIREHMEVVGSDGQHVGTVDHLEGNRIKLTKNDPMAGGQHHYIEMDAVDQVRNQQVRLRQPAQQVMQMW